MPTLGHAYAGDWERGVPPAGLAVLGTAVAVAGFGSCLDETGCDLLVAGIATAAAGKLWGIWSAVDAARDRNRELAAGLRPALSVGSGTLRVACRSGRRAARADRGRVWRAGVPRRQTRIAASRHPQIEGCP